MPPPAPSVDRPVPEDPDAETWVKNGKQAYVAGRFEEATAAFEKAVALNPRNGTALYNLGVVRNKTGDAAGAIEMFKRAARLGHERAMNLLTSQKIDW